MRYLEWLFWFAGVGLLGWFCITEAQAHAFQMQSNRELARISLPAPLTMPALPSSVAEQAKTPISSLLGRIEIPRLKVASTIEEGDDGLTLRKAVGHIPGTALPGGDGNVGLAAHRDSFFRALAKIRDGDLILLTTPGGTSHYYVGTTGVVPPDQISVLRPVGVPTLTLVTCYPFRYFGPAPNRYIVSAFLSGRINRPPTVQ